LAALVFTAILAIVWLSRARAARRFNAALDAYAEREIDRERRRNGPHRVRGASTRGGALPGGPTPGGGRPAEAEERVTRGRPASSRRKEKNDESGQERGQDRRPGPARPDRRADDLHRVGKSPRLGPARSPGEVRAG